jgi:hypothetical protein
MAGGPGIFHHGGGGSADRQPRSYSRGKILGVAILAGALVAIASSGHDHRVIVRIGAPSVCPPTPCPDPPDDDDCDGNGRPR